MQGREFVTLDAFIQLSLFPHLYSCLPEPYRCISFALDKFYVPLFFTQTHPQLFFFGGLIYFKTKPGTQSMCRAGKG